VSIHPGAGERAAEVEVSRPGSNAVQDLDVLVLGAGQAGLAAGYHLRTTGLMFAIVDGNDRVGDSWRRRFDSLALFTPRSYSALPGLAVAGDPDGLPGKDEIADYLEAYASRFQLPIQFGVAVSRLERDGSAFRATLADGSRIRAQAVIVATGAFQCPRPNPMSSGYSADVRQLHAADYTSPLEIGAGAVLVVGDGATGRQIALELAPSHSVVLSTGRPRRPTRSTILGRSVFWWLDRLGLLRASRDSVIGKRLMRADPFPGRHLDLDNLRAAGVTIVGRVATASGHMATFTEGPQTEVDTVIWATGYVDDTTWMAIPEVIDARGSFIERRGISPVPGLFFVGRSWQWTRGSALLTGVGADAAYVIAQLQSTLATRAKTSPAAEATQTPGPSAAG
jgi:putative flavoprotein involved in K+ transport